MKDSSFGEKAGIIGAGLLLLFLVGLFFALALPYFLVVLAWVVLLVGATLVISVLVFVIALVWQGAEDLFNKLESQFKTDD